MEGSQDIISKVLTKSSRKRLRKRQTAALEKFILASEAAGSFRLEPHPDSNPEGVEIRGCLSNIVFRTNSGGEKEFFASNSSPHNVVSSKAKSACCEGHENILFEKDQDTKKESVVHSSKRKRNGKKAPVLEVSSNNSDATVVAKIQKSFETQSTQCHGASQKEFPKQENSALLSLNHSFVKTSVVGNNKDLKKVEADKLSNVTDFKQQEETDDRVSTLSRSKRRRNRKKALTSSEQSDSQDKSIDSKGIKGPALNDGQVKFECPPQLVAKNLSSQKDYTSWQGLDPNPSISISSERPPSEVKSHPAKNNSFLKCVEISTGDIGRERDKKGGKSQVSTVPEKFGDISKKTCDNPSCKSLCEKKKGIRVKEADVCKEPLNLEKREAAAVAPELSAIKSKLLELIAKSDSCGSVCQREQGQSSLVFQKTCESSPTTFTLSTENHPTDMEGMQKNDSQFGKGLEESSGEDLGKAKMMFLSKGAPVARKAAPVQYDEVDRASAPMSMIEISCQGESIDKIEFMSKNVSNVKMNVVNKGSSFASMVVPAPSEVLDKSTACMDIVRIEESSGQPNKDDDSLAASIEAVDKLKEKVKAEREARKSAKLAKKNKDKTLADNKETVEILATPTPTPVGPVLLEKKVVELTEVKPIILPPQVSQDDEKSSIGKSKAELRAERRAKQEAQRAAKVAATVNKVAPSQEKVISAEQDLFKPKSLKGVKGKQIQSSSNLQKPSKKQQVKLLSRLGWGDGRVKRSTSEDNTLKETQIIHPAIVQLSTRFTDRIISGSNARCLAFVQAIKKAILDYQTPPQKELGRDMEARLLTSSLAYLESQRPHAISVLNATKFLKWQLTQLQPVQQCSLENASVPHVETKKAAIVSDDEAKKSLIEGLDAYIWEKIEVAERAVCDTLRDKIKDGDVILTYGCSYLLQQILTGAKKSGTKFKVVVVDGRPWREGREMLRCLVAVGIPCSYVLLSAASSVMRQVNKVLLGAHALLSNGYVMSRVGVSQVALLASAHNVPVLVACETHKFCERVQSDSFVYNEMGEPDGLAQLLGGEDGPLSDWRSIPSLSLLNLSYDVTPPELVTAVATELAVLPCTSVPVVLRVRPAEPITSRH